MSLAQKYRKSLEERWCLRLKTLHPDGDTYDGVVVDIKRQYVVLREEWDFEIGGLQVFPKRVIKGYRDGNYYDCANKILRHNGEIKKVQLPRWLAACVTLPQVVAELGRRDIWPGVEVIRSSDQESEYYVGPVLRNIAEGFQLRCYAADGTWEQEYYIGYADVFRIAIDGRYERHFNAYMRAKEGM